MPRTVVDHAKLARLACSTRGMVGEPLTGADDAAVHFASAALARLVVEIGSSLSDDALDELGRMIPRLPDDATSVDELRVLEAQLVGWLDGVIHAEAVEAG